MDPLSYDLETPSQPSRKKLDGVWLAQRISLVFSAYRKDEWTNPESFVAQLGVNLENFPMGVVEYVTDPKTGIQTRSKWPPSLAEFIEACRVELEHRKKVAKYSSLPPAAPLPRSRYSAEESFGLMFQKYGRPFGPFEVGRMLPYEA